jgi:hypothetical protein
VYLIAHDKSGLMILEVNCFTEVNAPSSGELLRTVRVLFVFLKRPSSIKLALVNIGSVVLVEIKSDVVEA